MATNVKSENVLFLENKKKEIYQRYNDLLAKKNYYDTLLRKSKEIQTKLQNIVNSKEGIVDFKQIKKLQYDLRLLSNTYKNSLNKDIQPIKDLMDSYREEIAKRIDPLSPDLKEIRALQSTQDKDFEKINKSFDTFYSASSFIRTADSHLSSYTSMQENYRGKLSNASEIIKNRHRHYNIDKKEYVYEKYNDPKLEDIASTLKGDTPQDYLDAIKKRIAYLKENDKELYEKSKDVFINLIERFEKEVEFCKNPIYSSDINNLKENLASDLKKTDISKISSLFETEVKDKSVDKSNDDKSKTEEKITVEEIREQKTDVNEADLKTSNAGQNVFDEALKKYSAFMQDYYADNKGTIGNAHTKEELKQRRKINDMMKKYIALEIKKNAENDKAVLSGEKDDKTIINEITNAVNPKDIEELSNSKGATLRLAQIMSSGVYEKDGQRVRLTLKQRAALSNVLAQAVEKNIDSKTKGKNDKVKTDEGIELGG